MAAGAEVAAAGGIMSHPHLGNVPEFHDWDTVSEVDSVWIGFMDIVPVIGTVKEAVELVLALYEGNPGVIREKAKAVENFVKESLQQPVKKSVPGKPAAAAADASDFSGLRNVREVVKEKIIEHVAKGSKRETKPTPAQQEQRKKRVQAIQREMLEKIRIINQNFKHELKEELERSKRGEHVFNNGILRFHSNVLAKFIDKQKIYKLHRFNQATIDELGKHTLQEAEDDIRYNMVVRFDDDEFYVNANAVAYGEYSRVLLGALLAVLGHINPDEETPEERQEVDKIIDNMNNLEIYVDDLAKEKWIGNKQDRQDQFEKVRGEVADMYKTDHGLEWCSDVLRKVAPWFGTRH